MSEVLVTPVPPEVASPRRPGIVRGFEGLAPFGGVVLAVFVLVYFHRSLSKPFWVDEQWRAYHVSVGFFDRAKGANAPIAAGWLIVERIFVAFRNTELFMRMPEALSLVGVNVGTYLLLRRWLGSIPSAVAAAGVVLLGDAIGYSTQLKPYTFEAAFTLAAVLGWFALHRQERSERFAFATYLGIGLCCVLATPTVFVVGPLLAYDAWRILRGDAKHTRLIPIGIAGLIAMVHLAFFIGPQSRISSSDYWEPYFVRGTGIPGFVWHRLGEWIPGILSGARSVSRVQRDLLNLAGIPLVFTGIWVVARDRRTRGLAVAFGGAMLLQLIAASVRLWPFGYVRTNWFLVPFVWAFAALGVATAIRGAAHAMRPRALFLPVAAIAALFAVASLAFAAAEAPEQHRHQKTLAYGYDVREIVEIVRSKASPGDVAVVIHQQGQKGWKYYMHLYDGYPSGAAHEIPNDHTAYVHRLKDTNLARFAQGFPDAKNLWMFVLRGGNLESSTAQAAGLRALGFCQSFRRDYRVSGTITEFTRGACR